MIEWFEKHLNAAIVFYTAFAWWFGYSLVMIIGLITGDFSIPGPPWFVEFYFTPNAMADIAIIVSLPVYYLILKKKQRSIWFLLLFLPPLIPVPAPTVLSFFMPFWLVGFITLLCLESRQPANG
jgi:hypothetical protein